MLKKIPFDCHEEWLKLRMEALGGSDAAAVLGLNQYKSAYALWAEKTGKVIPEDISDKETVRLGNDLEQYVAERFMETTGKKVHRCNFILKNDAYPFAHANPDRIVVGENAGLEIKTSSSWEIAEQLRHDEIPPYWYCQMVHYMMVTGAERWYLGALVFGVGFFHMTVERNQAEIDALAAAEGEFWAKVVSNTPPDVDGSEATKQAIKSIFPSSNGLTVDLAAVSSYIEQYNSLSKQIKQLTELQDEAANIIKNYMGAAEKGTYANVTVSWKSGSRKTFDKDSYESVVGKIPEEFYKTTETRTFRVTEKKGGK